MGVLIRPALDLPILVDAWWDRRRRWAGAESSRSTCVCKNRLVMHPTSPHQLRNRCHCRLRPRPPGPVHNQHQHQHLHRSVERLRTMAMPWRVCSSLHILLDCVWCDSALSVSQLRSKKSPPRCPVHQLYRRRIKKKAPSDQKGERGETAQSSCSG
jgi:hypothetical protein